MAKTATMVSAPSTCSRSAKLRLTGASSPNPFAAMAPTIASASKPMMSCCRSATSSTMRYTAATISAATPGQTDARDFGSVPAMRSNPLADLFLDQPGRAPSHEYDDDREGEHVLVGAAKGQGHRTDRLQCSEEEAAENGAVDAAQSADDGGRESDHAEQEP